jgi:flagellar basal-body rod protein FlgB
MSDIAITGGGLTEQLVGLALDAALKRHEAIAANIANVGTDGYRPMTSRFDEIVQSLQGRVTDPALDASNARLVETSRSSLEEQPWMMDPRTARVDLDMQMANLARNSLQYQALLTASAKLSGLKELVITEGK